VASAPASAGVESHLDAGQRVQTETSHPVQTASKETPKPSISRSGTHDVVEAVTAAEIGKTTDFQAMNLGISTDFLDQELQKIEKGVSAEFNRVINRELESLYQRIAEDKRIQDAAGTAKQDAILRLVSSTLGENVEKVLSRIITTSIQMDVIPSLGDVTALTLDKRLSDVLNQHLHHAIPPLLKLSLPEAISRGVQNPEVLRVIAEQITGKLTSHVEKEFNKILQNTIVPTFKNLAVSVAQSSKLESDNRMREYLKNAESQHKDDTSKIDQLTLLVRGLSETVHTMAAAQSEFQRQILKLQEQAIQERQRGLTSEASPQEPNVPTPSTSRVPPKSPEQEELEMIRNLMNEGRSEEGTIHWIQSSRQGSIFDNLLVRCDPSYLRHLPPLVILSVGAAVTSSLENNVMDRLAWLETVFATIDPRDPEIREVAPRIMDVLCQRLESEYMRISMANPRDLSLHKIPLLVRQARELKERTRV
jgi:hypothetical protein